MTKTVRADLHNHLRTSSRMRKGDFNRAVNKTYRRLGSGGIIGLVNFDDHRYEDFSGLRGYDRQNIKNALYIPEKDILVIKGQEVPTEQGHLLVLAIPENIHLKSGITLEDSLKEAKDHNGIIIADHPFYKWGIGLYLQKNPELIESLDAIEIHNGEAVWIPGLAPGNTNEKAQKYFLEARKEHPHLGAISTSDGHSFYEIGKSYTTIPKPIIENSEFLTTTLRKGIRESPKYELTGHTSTTGVLNHILAMILIEELPKLLGKK